LNRLFLDPSEPKWPPQIDELIERPGAIFDKRILLSEQADEGEPDDPYEAGYTTDLL